MKHGQLEDHASSGCGRYCAARNGHSFADRDSVMARISDPDAETNFISYPDFNANNPWLLRAPTAGGRSTHARRHKRRAAEADQFGLPGRSTDSAAVHLQRRERLAAARVGEWTENCQDDHYYR